MQRLTQPAPFLEKPAAWKGEGEMSEWQPIETRKKLSNKTGPFLVYFPNHGIELARQEFSGADTILFNGRRTLLYPLEWMDPKTSPAHPPTHWMPLPDPPAK